MCIILFITPTFTWQFGDVVLLYKYNKKVFAMVSETEVLEMFNKFPEVPERIK